MIAKMVLADKPTNKESESEVAGARVPMSPKI